MAAGDGVEILGLGLRSAGNVDLAGGQEAG
jgi:hypothetical protein